MKVMFTGSFDPITNGHLDILRRVSALFSVVYAVVFIHPEKACRYTVEERKAMLAAACRDLSNVVVDASEGFAADYAKAHGIDAFVRGIRSVDDLPYELEMARYNKERSEGIETILLPAAESVASLSASAVRKMLEKGESPQGFVPDAILPLL